MTWSLCRIMWPYHDIRMISRMITLLKIMLWPIDLASFAVLECLRQNVIETPPWPAWSPDLYPREHLRDILDRQVRQIPPVHSVQLAAVLHAEWTGIPQRQVHRLIHGMKKRGCGFKQYLLTKLNELVVLFICFPTTFKTHNYRNYYLFHKLNEMVYNHDGCVTPFAYSIQWVRSYMFIDWYMYVV